MFHAKKQRRQSDKENCKNRNGDNAEKTDLKGLLNFHTNIFKAMCLCDYVVKKEK